METTCQTSQQVNWLDLSDLARSCGFVDFQVLITDEAWNQLAPTTGHYGLSTQRAVLDTLHVEYHRHLRSDTIEFEHRSDVIRPLRLKSVLYKGNGLVKPQILIMLPNQKV